MKRLPRQSPRLFRACRERAPAWVQWISAACAAVAVVALLSLAFFTALARWQPGVLVAQAPSLAVDRAGRANGPQDASGETRVIAR